MYCVNIGVEMMINTSDISGYYNKLQTSDHPPEIAILKIAMKEQTDSYTRNFKDYEQSVERAFEQYKLQIEEIRVEADKYKGLYNDQVSLFSALQVRCDILRKQLESIPPSVVIAHAETKLLNSKLIQLKHDYYIIQSEEQKKILQMKHEFDSIIEKEEMDKHALLEKYHAQVETIHQLSKHVQSLRLNQQYSSSSISNNETGRLLDRLTNHSLDRSYRKIPVYENVGLSDTSIDRNLINR
jgi:hypothetical protein